LTPAFGVFDDEHLVCRFFLRGCNPFGGSLTADSNVEMLVDTVNRAGTAQFMEVLEKGNYSA
jgi:hypothetical protein